MTLTQEVLAFVAILLVIYDLVAAVTWGVNATISSVVLKASRVWPILPFALGVVMGHIFWPNGP